jgi:CHAT domain-containing protein/tetratricopeptide (TPR) repeat protein
MRCRSVVQSLTRLFGQRPSQTIFRHANLLISSNKHNASRLLIVAACLLLILAESISAYSAARHHQPASARGTRLAVGNKLEKALASGEQHSYWLKLAPGQFIAVQLEQQGVDVALMLFNADQQPVAAANYISSLRGAEQLVFVAAVAGNYLLQVRGVTLYGHVSGGRYQLSLTQLRVATPLDRQRVTAQAAFNEGEQLRGADTEASWREALKHFAAAREHWRVAADRVQEALALARLGDGQAFLDQLPQAQAQYQQALELLRGLQPNALNKRQHEALLLAQLSSVQRRLGQSKAAEESAQLVLTLSRSVADEQIEAAGLRQLAELKRAAGETRAALKLYQQASTYFHAGGDWRAQAQTLNEAGFAFYQLGETQEALGHLTRAWALQHFIKDARAEAVTLNDLGVVCFALGERQPALRYFQRAAQLSQTLAENRPLAVALSNLGRVYHTLGDWPQALSQLQRAWELRHAASDRLGEANVLASLGRTHFALKEYEQAQRVLTEALALYRAMREPRGEASTLLRLGDVDFVSQRTAAAIARFKEALQLSRAGADRQTEAEALYQLARVDYAQHDLPAAQQRLATALELAESLRYQVGAPELRESFFETVQDYYQLYIHVLIQQHKGQPRAGYDALAFAASERKRARSMLDLLSPAQTATGANTRLLTLAELQQRILKPGTLLLEYALGEQASYLWVVSRDALHSYELPPRAVIEKAAQQVYRLLADQADESGPAHKVSWREFSDAARPLSEMLLGTAAPLLAGQRLWIVADGVLHLLPFGALPLPRAVQFDPSAQLTALSVTATAPVNWPNFPVSPDFGARGEHKAETHKTDRARASRLEDAAKINPAALAPSSTIAQAEAAANWPLLLAHEVANCPSAQTLAVLQQRAAAQPPAPHALAIFADPVFGKYDDRVRRSARRAAAKPRPVVSTSTKPPGERAAPLSVAELLTREEQERTPVLLPRLTYAREEAEAIVKIAAPQGVLKAFDFQASLARALSPELGQYRIVHFATHSRFSSEQPEASGLYFSLLNERGEATRGLLRVHELAALRLNAELVVLSACETGLGKEVGGEGLVGLTRGLMAAGAKRVVASLWKVNDAATAALMQRFYLALLDEQLRTPAAALRQAQMSLWQEAQWQAPYYWAAFVLQGEH